MRINLQKILILISALSITLSAISFAVSAQTVNESPMTNQEYYSSQAYLISQYCDGKITYSQFQERSQAVTDNYVNNNTIGGVVNSGVLNASNTVSAVSQKIGSTVQKYGEAAKDKVSGWISDFMDDYSSLSEIPVTDTKGYGAMVVAYHIGNWNKTIKSIYYCDYVVLNDISESGNQYDYSLNNYTLIEIYKTNGSVDSSYQSYIKLVCNYLTGSYGCTYEFYGDIRNYDGTKAPTNDEYIQVDDFDFTQVPENDLEQLFQNMINELENKMPNLDSIEGILQAIYYKCCSIDSKIITSGELNSLINSAVNLLIAEMNNGSTGDTTNIDNSKIIEILENLKTEVDTKSILDKLNEIYPEYDYETEISRTEELKALFLVKWGFVEELKTLIDRFMSSYEKNSSLTTMDNVIHVKYNPKNGSFGNVILNHNGSYDIKFDIFEPYLPTIRGIIAAFIYLSFAWNTYRKIPSYIRGGDAE